MVQSMMSLVDLLISLCDYTLETARYTLNRVPTKTAQKTPYEIWIEKRHSWSFMKILGCEAFVESLASKSNSNAMLYLVLLLYYSIKSKKTQLQRGAIFGCIHA